jgi:hypothetical protein
MTIRVPPRVATWLLTHLGTAYQGDSLAGDLFEEYQQNRTPAWYWGQTAVAVFLGRVRRLHLVLSKFVLATVLRVLIELGIILGGIALAQSKGLCPALSSVCQMPAAGSAPGAALHTDVRPQ